MSTSSKVRLPQERLEALVFALANFDLIKFDTESQKSHSDHVFGFYAARAIRSVEKSGCSDPFVTASCLFQGKKKEFLKTHHIVLTTHPQVRLLPSS